MRPLPPAISIPAVTVAVVPQAQTVASQAQTVVPQAQTVVPQAQTAALVSAKIVTVVGEALHAAPVTTQQQSSQSDETRIMLQKLSELCGLTRIPSSMSELLSFTQGKLETVKQQQQQPLPLGDSTLPVLPKYKRPPIIISRKYMNRLDSTSVQTTSGGAATTV